jgi:hypothetical protein
MEASVFRKLQEVHKMKFTAWFCCNPLDSSSVFTVLVEYIYALFHIDETYKCFFSLCRPRKGSSVDNLCFTEDELATYRWHLLSQVTTAEDHEDNSVTKSEQISRLCCWYIVVSYSHAGTQFVHNCCHAYLCFNSIFLLVILEYVTS